MALHLVFGVVAIVVGAITILAVDRLLFRKLKIEEEIQKGNMAAAAFFGAMWIALAIVMTRAG